MKMRTYEEAPVWAQGKKGTLAPIPLAGSDQRYAFSDYRDRYATITLTYQKRVLVLTPPGLFWRAPNPAAFYDPRAKLSQRALCPSSSRDIASRIVYMVSSTRMIHFMSRTIATGAQILHFNGNLLST